MLEQRLPGKHLTFDFCVWPLSITHGALELFLGIRAGKREPAASAEIGDNEPGFLLVRWFF